MRPAPPPRSLLYAAALTSAAAVPLTLVGGWVTGVSWDETYHVMRLRTFLADGWYLLERDMLGSAPGPWEQQQYVYGPATTLLLHAWSVLWGVEGWGEVSATAGAFAVRHLGVALISFAGLAATAALTRTALGSWRWGLVGAAALVAVPTWSGHAMFNVKDVSVATGYTMVTLGLALLPRPREPRFGLLISPVLIVLGTILAVGTRPGIAPGLLAAALLTLLTRDRWRWACVPPTVAASGLALWVLYPAVFSDPATALWRGALSSSRFDEQQGAWWYLPLFLAVELPTLHLLLGAAGVAVAAVTATRRPGGPRLLLGLVLLQALLLPTLAVLRQANLYTGLRQLLFAAPALAVLVALALAQLVRASASTTRPRTARLLPLLGAAALLLPLLAQVQLFPYGYAYRSPLALVGAPLATDRDPTWELQTDYWRTSVRELAPHVPGGTRVTCTPSRGPDGRFWPWSSESHDDCRLDLVGPLRPYLDQHADRRVHRRLDATRFTAVVTGTDRGAGNCARTAAVTRRLWWRKLTMSYVARCDLVLARYPVGGLRLDGSGHDGQALLHGWDVHRARVGVGVRGESATLGVRLAPRLRARPLLLRASAVGSGHLAVLVNGRPVPLEVTGRRVRARVPAQLSAAYGDGRVLVELVRTRAEPVRLLTLRLTATGSRTTTPTAARSGTVSR